MLITAGLSMWMSNTAATVMVLPVAQAVIEELYKVFIYFLSHIYGLTLSLKDHEVTKELKEVELTKPEESPSNVLSSEVADGNRNTFDEEIADITNISIK